MGVVGRPHGVRGLVHVTAYTETPAALADYALFDDQNRRWRLVWRAEGVAELRDSNNISVADRTAAEKLVNLKLYAERASLPQPAADEFYLADLIGLMAVTSQGRNLGNVREVHDYGAGASLEIATGRAAVPVLVPFTKRCVPEVDLARGMITVELPDEIMVQEAESA